ncbi:hypothetical protein FACS1894208_09150 [Clostridia bacterium]|nr:hypothetical protein FACS1894208_09150 [Clostridia bacterium]
MLQFYLSMLDTEDERRTLTDIYERYYNRYMCVAMKRLNNHALAEDAVHMAFLAIIEQKEKIFALSGSDFLRYTDSIVRNESLNILKKERKYTEIGEFEQLPDESESVEELVASKIDIEKLTALMDKLDDDEQQILRSKYIFNKSYQEIAREMGITVKNVEVKLYRIRKKAKQLLLEEGVTVG